MSEHSPEAIAAYPYRKSPTVADYRVDEGKRTAFDRGMAVQREADALLLVAARSGSYAAVIRAGVTP